MSRRWMRWTVLVIACGTVLVPGAHADVVGCATGSSGGEWRSYNADLANSRHQAGEAQIGPENAAELEPSWSFVVPVGLGDIQTTPVIADGCVYLPTYYRTLFVLNAETGALVQRIRLEGGTISGSPVVEDGRIILHMNTQPRTTVALDQGTGEVLWQTAWDEQAGTQFFASPVVFDGMVLSGMSGILAEEDGTPGAGLLFRGSYAILDVETGEVLEQDFVIPDEDFADGYSGGSIWSTPAVDTGSSYAFIGTGNPFSPKEHQNTNAIIKIDVDPDRDTFGRVVGSYHGTVDQYHPALEDKPVCELYVYTWTCFPLDLDFGASAQLFHAADGRLLVGDHQKSGIYHVADAETMTGEWATVIGVPWPLGGASTASFDGELVNVAAAQGPMFGLDKDDGATRWMSPTFDPWQSEGPGLAQMHSQPVTTANGVAYMMDGRGVLWAVDSSSGLPLLARPLVRDTQVQSSSPGAGVAVARNTVFATAGRNLVALRVR